MDESRQQPRETAVPSSADQCGEVAEVRQRPGEQADQAHLRAADEGAAAGAGDREGLLQRLRRREER